ncbi:cytochrome C oxidase subunit IV family protein [Sinorhizobium sp. CCBAU 05631]|uniref:cytochrome C oxidase subunit IV family protein n=1 Tax=Sinorhizobium sp. CCBAU 05631 TaxID=794846 RepID=UPI0004AF300A|nr:cytochrome C oxidase subunit IV family protein [Sinorhizobium sp. CCBAU 05631]ASY60786.1 Nitric oxide reductase activation protein NorF [Sinorhizobium sp. CCBAU 05631]
MSDRSPKQLKKTWMILVLMIVSGLPLSLKVQDPAAPLVFTLALLTLAVLKARLVVLDFLGLRSGPRVLRVGLIAWPLFFALAAAAKALIAVVSPVG